MPNRWLAFLTRDPPPATPPPRSATTVYAVAISGREVTVTLRRNARAKRYTLRITPRGDGAIVTLPRRGTVAGAKAFVDSHLEWIAGRLAAAGPAVDGLQPGDTVPVRGHVCRVVSTGTARGIIRITESDDGPALMVPGDPAHAGRRVRDHLKRLARADLEAAVRRHADALGVRPTAVRIKDTTSRWGSASSGGTLSFSWRLVMAPPFVLDYLAAHEVAHLKEMNHSNRFWAICRRLAPHTEEARAWLKAHGRDLHRVI